MSLSWYIWASLPKLSACLHGATWWLDLCTCACAYMNAPKANAEQDFYITCACTFERRAAGETQQQIV